MFKTEYGSGTYFVDDSIKDVAIPQLKLLQNVTKLAYTTDEHRYQFQHLDSKTEAIIVVKLSMNMA